MIPRSAGHQTPQPYGAAGTPWVRYRCAVQTQLPYILSNVTNQRRGLVVLGSPNTVAWSMIGMAAMSIYGRSKAKALEGQTVYVPASGQAEFTDDRIILHVTTANRVRRVSLRAESVSLEIPYRLVRQWGGDANGLWFEVVGKGLTRLRTPNDREVFDWVAYLVNGRAWHQPVALPLTPPSMIAGWCQQDPRFTYALLPGWSYFPPAAFADYARSFLPDRLCSGIGVDAGPWEVQLLVIDCGPASAILDHTDSDSLAAELISGLDPPGGVSSIVLDGEPAVLARARKPTVEGIFDRTYGTVTHHDVLYFFWYSVVGGTLGDGSHERWLPEFHSTLATWHWY